LGDAKKQRVTSKIRLTLLIIDDLSIAPFALREIALAVSNSSLEIVGKL